MKSDKASLPLRKQPSRFVSAVFFVVYDGDGDGSHPFISHPIKFRHSFIEVVITENEPLGRAVNNENLSEYCS